MSYPTTEQNRRKLANSEQRTALTTIICGSLELRGSPPISKHLVMDGQRCLYRADLRNATSVVFSELGDRLCFRLAIGTRHTSTHLFFTIVQLANRSQRISLAASSELSCAVHAAGLFLLPYSQMQHGVSHSMPIEISAVPAYTAQPSQPISAQHTHTQHSPFLTLACESFMPKSQNPNPKA